MVLHCALEHALRTTCSFANDVGVQSSLTTEGSSAGTWSHFDAPYDELITLEPTTSRVTFSVLPRAAVCQPIENGASNAQ